MAGRGPNERGRLLGSATAALGGARDGLVTGSALGLVHAMILASGGLYATTGCAELLASFARYAGLLGLTGGLMGLVAGAALALLGERWARGRPSPSGFLLPILYVLAWIFLGAKGALGLGAALTVTVVVALILLGALTGFLWVLVRRRTAAGPAGGPAGRTGLPTWSLVVLVIADLVLYVVPLAATTPVPDLDRGALDGMRLEPLRERARERFAEQRWNLLLLTVDTLRADHMGCYGYLRETTPAIDRLSRSGVLFEHAICQRPKTSPSFATILTGTYPLRHGIHRCLEVLEDWNLTMAEILSEAGWHAAAVITNGNLYPEFGFDQGFGTYLYGHMGAAAGTDLSLAWLEEHGHTEEPWFLWIHHTDPHTPYEPPAPYDGLFAGGAKAGDGHDREVHPREVHPYKAGTERERKTDLYDGEIRYTDDQLGRILEWLEARGPLDRTLVVFTSDHGESLGEHDYYYEHGLHPYEPSGRIPLIFFAPGVIPSGKISPAVVGAVDLLPTLLDALGVPVPSEVQGHSFLPAVVGLAEMGPRDFAFLEAGYGPHIGPGRTQALRRIATKYVQRLTLWARYPQDPVTIFWTIDACLEGGLASDELYDLRTDPGETVNLLKERPDLARRELQMIRAFTMQSASELPEELDLDQSKLAPETLESLKSLGYIK